MGIYTNKMNDWKLKINKNKFKVIGGNK